MHVGVAVYNLRPGKKVEATRIWEESFCPVARQQRDFKAALWLMAPDMDKAIGIELWDIDTAASSFESSGLFDHLVSEFRDVLLTPPEREQYQTTSSVLVTSGTPDPKSGTREIDSLNGTPSRPAFRILST